MALIDMQGFDTGTYRNSPNWQFGNTDTETASPFGGYYAQLSVNAFAYYYVLDPTTKCISTLTMAGKNYYVIGFRYMTPGLTSSGIICEVLGSAATGQICVTASTGSAIVLRRGTTSGTVLITSSTPLTTFSWYYIEIKVDIDNAGSAELFIDGTSAGTFSGDTQGEANADIMRIAWYGGTGFAEVDDFYILDDTGAHCNDRLSTALETPHIETVFASSNDSVTWTPLASTNASNVDETIMDGDTTYNSVTAGTGSKIDMFNHTALSFTPNTIYAVKPEANIRKSDTVTQPVRTKLDSNGTVVDGDSYEPPTVYRRAEDIIELNPDTGTAWTKASVDATKIGYELI